MSFISVAAGQPIRATHVQQFTNWLTAQKLDTPGVVACTSTSEFALTVRSQEGTTGMAMAVQYGAASSPTTLAYFTKDSSRISSSDGTDYLQITNSGVAVTGAFSVNGSPVGAGFPVYNVADYGMTEGNSTSYSLANATALTTLWATVANAGYGGIIYFPEGDWHCNPVTLNHGLTSAKSISIWGCGGATRLKFNGSTGPYLTIASTATSPVQMCGIRDIWINHAATPTAGATIRLGYTSRFVMENVAIFGNEARIAVQLIAQASVHMKSCTLSVQDNSSAICLDIATTLTTGGIQLTACDLSGVYPNTRGVTLNNTALVDTMVFNGVSMKDHNIAFSSQFGTGEVKNVQFLGGYTDGCDYGVILSPSSGATYGSFDFANMWLYGAKQSLILSKINGGLLSSVNVFGGTMPGSTQGPVEIIGSVTDVIISGVRLGSGETNNGSYSGIKLSDDGSGNVPNKVTITGNSITVGTSAAACVTIPTSTASFTVIGNSLNGGAAAGGMSIGGSLSAARVAATSANSYTA